MIAWILLGAGTFGIIAALWVRREAYRNRAFFNLGVPSGCYSLEDGHGRFRLGLVEQLEKSVRVRFIGPDFEKCPTIVDCHHIFSQLKQGADLIIGKESIELTVKEFVRCSPHLLFNRSETPVRNQTETKLRPKSQPLAPNHLSSDT